MIFFLQQMTNGLMYGFTYSLIGIGFNLIFGVLNILNIAHGDVIMVASFIGLSLVLFFQLNIFWSFLGSIIAAAVIGILVEQVTIRPLLKEHHLIPLISTIGASIFLSELFILLFTSEEQYFQNPIEYVNLWLGPIYIRLSYFLTMLISLLLILTLHILLKKTNLGRKIRATAENSTVACFMGINVNRIIIYTIALASGLGGAAGVLFGLNHSSIYPTMGMELTLKGLIVIVLGGLGSMGGALLAGIILGIVEILSTAYFSGSVRDFFAFGLLFWILILKPSGLLGEKISSEF